MSSFTTALRSAAAALVCLAVIPSSPAQDQDQNPDQSQDPPGRVARLSLTQGAVSLQPAGDQEWATADVNRPLTTGDKLWTDQDSRAELDIGSAAVRLGSTTGFSFLNLDDHTTQIQVTAGTLIVRVRSMDKGDNFEVDTPNLALSLLQPGQYRVEVNEAGDSTVVKIAEGEAQAAEDGTGYPIHAQQKATFTGTQQLSSVVGSLGAPDELDDWSLTRDRQVQSAQSQQYVSPEATGYADLDNNGRWEDTPDYGYVWTPTAVAVGWAPYRFGHWVWIGPWGWTWVDDAPWGFAPFHYGRWVSLHDSWCWVPGPRRLRPVYAPALVAWVGRPGLSVSVSVGAGVGWFPLGPREVYVPSYRVSPRYVERVNVTNTVIVNRTYITNVYQNRVTNVTYVNRNVRGAVTTVPQNVFTSAQPVGRNRMRVSDDDLRNFTARGTAPAITPVRESLVGAGARVNVRLPPTTLANRQVVVRTTPPRGPVSFDRQSEAIRANGGRPLGRAELSRLEPSAPAAAVHVVTPPREGTSMADRERAIRDGRQFNAPDNRTPDSRPPVVPRQGMRSDRPPNQQSPQVSEPPAAQPGANQQPSPGQSGRDFRSRDVGRPPSDTQQRNDSQPQNDVPRRFDRPPQNQVRPQPNPERPIERAPDRPQAPPPAAAPPQQQVQPEPPHIRTPRVDPRMETRSEPRAEPPPRAEPRPAPQVRQPPVQQRAEPRGQVERPPERSKSDSDRGKKLPE